jgi:hypothetical protein
MAIKDEALVSSNAAGEWLDLRFAGEAADVCIDVEVIAVLIWRCHLCM